MTTTKLLCDNAAPLHNYMQIFNSFTFQHQIVATTFYRTNLFSPILYTYLIKIPLGRLYSRLGYRLTETLLPTLLQQPDYFYIIDMHIVSKKKDQLFFCFNLLIVSLRPECFLCILHYLFLLVFCYCQDIRSVYAMLMFLLIFRNY